MVGANKLLNQDGRLATRQRAQAALAHDGEFARPASIADLAVAAKTDARRVQVDAAACIAIEPYGMKERTF